MLEYNEAGDYDRFDDECLVCIDDDFDFNELIDSVIFEVERNLRKHGIVGFARDWSDHQDALSIADYLYLKGVRTEMDKGGIETSPIATEIEILNRLLL